MVGFSIIRLKNDGQLALTGEEEHHFGVHID